MFYSCREISEKWSTWPQWLAAFEVVHLGLSNGLAGGWTSPFLAKLTGPDSELAVTNEEASWIASLVPVGRVLGAMCGSINVYYFGSKFSVLCTGLPLALSWIFLIIANSVNWIYAARLLQGISVGMFFGTVPLYVGEVSHPKIRGAMISVLISALAIGFIVGNLMGSLMSMWLFSVVSAIPTVGFLLFFALLPATPHYLVSQERYDEAAESILWYQRDADVKKELESLRRFVTSMKSLTFCETLREFSVPQNRKALVMVAMVFILLQIGGTYTLGYYMEIILRRAGVKTLLDPGMAVVVIGIVGISGGFFAMYANDKYGRKMVLGGSCFGLTISLGLLGAQYVFIDHNLATPSLECLPIVAMMAVEFFVNLGIGPVPSTMVSEIFSPRTKSIASCVANMSSGLFAFVNTKTYQAMIDTMPDQYVIWFYGIVMGLLGVYTVIVLPETKGKSLQEIQDMLSLK
ncbi:facilitated trehalose transporter Tret1-like [Venturia canescens]|uniref:facilitated trehalose transporter Tret1-like n=1 Tax=Venturia canescens TaxID=32260 RepID=UPI001C9C77DC|nr:facilitated trehalose transporter Tret1-like [Venturia canescens]